MRFFFDRQGDYAGSSMQGWEIILLLCFPVAILAMIILYPIFIWLMYSNRYEDEANDRDGKKLKNWYPWYKYKAAYITGLVLWFIAFIMTLTN